MKINEEKFEFLQKIKKEHSELFLDLSPREKDILELRYGFSDSRPRTYEEIGILFGVKKERIRQIEAKALRRLEAYLELKENNSALLEIKRQHRGINIRAWNALRYSENPSNPYTIEQLSNRNFLLGIHNLGKKSVEEILKNVELYIKKIDKRAEITALPYHIE